MLCEKCSNIHFRRLEDCDLIKQEPERLLTTGPERVSDYLFYFHQPNKHALEKSSDNGCHFCAMILNRLFGDGRNFEKREEWSFTHGEVILRRDIVEKWINRIDGFERWNTGDWICVQCEDRIVFSTTHGGYSGE